MAVALVDIFDPNTWELYNDWEFRVYSDDYANEWAIVDQIDYQHLVQWRWRIKPSRVWNGTKKPKKYLFRAGHESLGPSSKDEDGKIIRNRIVSSIYLHTVVMERTGIAKPKTNQKLIVDHANGKEFDCRRKNLRWATISFNNKNRFGSHERTFFDEEIV